ncbi:MAG: DUF354 domain-containing protein [Acidobacteriota bacterium]|nr:DUF354 domain-containing protein [Acidobacteriota bacterium]
MPVAQKVSARELERSTAGKRKKIWIDLDNSPHVPFFLPIIEELERRGFAVVLTARDSYQVCELLRLHRISCRVVGRHYGKRWIWKVLGTAFRAVQLLPAAITERPQLAVSHGSRAQFLLASALRIPTVVMIDYEFVKTFGALHPNWTFVPDVISMDRLHQKPDHVLRYHGLKEDVYVPRFKPDRNFRSQLGIRQDELVVTVRPPATEAHYHNPEGEQFLEETLEYLLNSSARAILLPRNDAQASKLRASWTDAIEERRFIIPDHAIDGLNLIWNSDLVISGGGTMNREAAALGVPVYSIFRGRLGAVDRYLAESGRLIVIDRLEDIHAKIALVRKAAGGTDAAKQSAVLNSIVDAIDSIAEHQCLPTQQ